MIQGSDPRAEYIAHKAEIDAAIARVLDGGRYILGEEVAAFEAEMAAYLGVRAGVGVASGTEAIQLALGACGVGRDDEVVTVSHTAVATVAAIEAAGASPVLVDVDGVRGTLDPARLEAAIGPRVKAVIAVHLYGQPADVPAIAEICRRKSVRLIEDCAQAHGAAIGGRRAGSFGDLACFSFYPTKNLGALGDGGMVASDDAELAGRVRLLREYGWADRYVSKLPGINSRLDEIQAAILRVKLRSLDAANAARMRIAERYDRALADTAVVLPARIAGTSHVFHLYVVRSDRRDDLQAHLKEKGIGAAIHYPVPVHLQPAYRGRVRMAGSLAETERAAREVLSLPIHPQLRDEQADRVCDAVREFAGRKEK